MQYIHVSLSVAIGLYITVSSTACGPMSASLVSVMTVKWGIFHPAWSGTGLKRVSQSIKTSSSLLGSVLRAHETPAAGYNSKMFLLFHVNFVFLLIFVNNLDSSSLLTESAFSLPREKRRLEAKWDTSKAPH